MILERQNAHKMRAFLNMTVNEIAYGGKLPAKAVISIDQDEKAINAFNKMLNNNVSGLAVVDSEVGSSFCS